MVGATVVPMTGAVGARAAVEELYRAEAAALVGMLWVLVGDRATAEDLAQEAFVRLQRSWHRVTDPDRAAAYLRSIAMNLARSRVRHLRVVDRHPAEPPPLGRAADDGLVLRDDQRAVIEAVRSLPERQRQCVVLRFYGGLTEAAIADALGCSRSSVKVHLRRALASLALLLEDRR